MMSRLRSLVACGLWCILATSGCQQPGKETKAVDLGEGVEALFKPMGDLLKLPPPVRVGMTRDYLPHISILPDLSSWDRFMGPLETAPWIPLQQALSKDLDRPVHFERSNPRSIRYHLGTGRMQLAMVSASDYAEITARPVSQIIAVPVNVKGTTQHAGLIVVKADSPIKTLAELKGKRFSFGPRNDPILHLGAMQTLAKAGITGKDIPKELLPPYGHHFNSYEIAKAVLFEGVPAGVIDELEYESWPAKNNLLTTLSVCQNSFRILATTDPVPEGPLVASVTADPQLVEKVRDILITRLNGNKSVLERLHYKGFQAGDASLYKDYIAAYKTTTQAATTGPAAEESKN
jgi:ABC-type phosphate/phosphonate transport system substrate-binding protein